MAKIGGNIEGIIQTKKATGAKNAIGEAIHDWVKAASTKGWLSLQSGESKYNSFQAKVEESSHVFLCDYNAEIYALSLPDKDGKLPDVRMILKGIIYDVLLIDNPDERNEQLEIYLRRVGAAHG